MTESDLDRFEEWLQEPSPEGEQIEAFLVVLREFREMRADARRGAEFEGVYKSNRDHFALGDPEMEALRDRRKDLAWEFNGFRRSW